MGKKYDFNYIVIGSGPAGSAAALEIAKTKKKVAIVEGRFFGGTNLNTIDIPYATALDFSHTYNKMLEFPEVSHQDIYFNFPTVAARQLKTVIAAGGNNKEIFENAGITCIKGFANFLDNHTIAVNEKKYTAENFVLATGSHLKTGEISGTETVEFFTPETIIRTRRLPEVVAVVGGGATGCEIAEYLAELGVKTLIFETAERLLPREDLEVGETLAEYFNQKLGASVLTSSKVVAIEEDGVSKRVIFRNDNTEKMVRVSAVVLATGSQPNLDYGLENAGVKYKNSGIVVDKYFNTSAKNIYAVGDCLGVESSTDRAHQEGFMLGLNLAGKAKNTLDYAGLVRSVKTYPEVAVVGLTEDDLLKRDRKYKKGFVKLGETTASKIYNFDYGFVKILANKSDKIIGATVVAPGAELIIEELALAVRHNLTALEIASTPHVRNSYNYAVKMTAKQILDKKK